VEALAEGESHPRWLVARWVERWGIDATARLLRANNVEAPVVVRAYGVSEDALAAELAAAGVGLTAPPAGMPWPTGSIALAPGASLTELGAYRQGHFHVQDPASTWVTEYAAIPAGWAVADVCAAPGGKAAELARTASVIYAGDRSAARLRRVITNVGRLGLTHVLPYVGDARTPPFEAVDAALVDAPCTGTGTFRRHPDARWRLKVSDLAVMSAVQRQILRAVAERVRPGGVLVYSTCSLEPEENDAPIDGFLAEHPEWTLEPPPAGTVPEAVLDGGRLRVLPHQHGSDGAFAVRLRRREG
jgi:16S rRNA (cytosine967-C5)-methyltransferase